MSVHWRRNGAKELTIRETNKQCETKRKESHSAVVRAAHAGSVQIAGKI